MDRRTALGRPSPRVIADSQSGRRDLFSEDELPSFAEGLQWLKSSKGSFGFWNVYCLQVASARAGGDLLIQCADVVVKDVTAELQLRQQLISVMAWPIAVV